MLHQGKDPWWGSAAPGVLVRAQLCTPTPAVGNLISYTGRREPADTGVVGLLLDLTSLFKHSGAARQGLRPSPLLAFSRLAELLPSLPWASINCTQLFQGRKIESVL